MHLNTLKPSKGAKQAPKRVGRGIGSGLGKTGGLGHKGQKARAGGFHKLGFEGGQMPLQRRVPKSGFRSRKSLFKAEIRLSELNEVNGNTVDMAALKNANLITSTVKYVKVIQSGELKKAVHLVGIKATAGAKKAIESMGGKVE